MREEEQRQKEKEREKVKNRLDLIRQMKGGIPSPFAPMLYPFSTRNRGQRRLHGASPSSLKHEPSIC